MMKIVSVAWLLLLAVALAQKADRKEITNSIGMRLAPIEAEVRRRLGNFVIAEDDQTMEGVILAKLREAGQRRWEAV